MAGRNERIDGEYEQNWFGPRHMRDGAGVGYVRLRRLCRWDVCVRFECTNDRRSTDDGANSGGDGYDIRHDLGV